MEIITSNYLDILWLIETNNNERVNGGERKESSTRSPEKILPPAESNYRNQLSYSHGRRKRLLSDPNICTGYLNGQPYETVTSRVSDTFIYQLDKMYV